MKTNLQWIEPAGTACAGYFASGTPACRAKHGAHAEYEQGRYFARVLEYVSAIKDSNEEHAANAGLCSEDPDRVAGRLLAYCWSHRHELARALAAKGGQLARRWRAESANQEPGPWHEGAMDAMEEASKECATRAVAGHEKVIVVSERWCGGPLSAPIWGAREEWGVSAVVLDSDAEQAGN
jgi:hypothetical protein